ncbi:MAG TPA: response regulator [Terracidiphilus sp.]|jgi:DNA-binding NtrC family response regulator|nr:response regulator [Terracidiphilus sp.]
MPMGYAPQKILIVDDEAPVADSLQLILAARGYDVRAVYSAEQAIEVMAAWPPKLAIVDVMLPQMNGIELAKVLKENYPECRVLLISGHPGTSELLTDANAQGTSFEVLAKPLHPTFILDTVSDLLPEKSNGAEMN